MVATRKNALICLNGHPLQKDLLFSKVEEADCVIAADGGLNWLVEYQVEPDFVVGDLDSAKKEYMGKIKAVHVDDQNSTDLEKSLMFAMREGFSTVNVVGIESGRIDHLLANFFLLSNFAQTLDLQIIGDNWVGKFLQKKNKIIAAQNTIVSIIPFSPCKGLTLEGFEYPLSNQALNVGEVGVSNRTIKEKVLIHIETGIALGIFYDLNTNWGVM